MRRTRATAGFTLFELSVVLLIMGTMAALAAPGMSQVMADTRASAATEELVRLNRVIRSRVNQTGLAHLLVFNASASAAGSEGLGVMRLYEGMNNRCRQTPWAQAIAADATLGQAPIETFDLADSAYNLPSGGSAPTASDLGRHVVQVRVNGGGTNAVLCFEPSGSTFTGVSDGTAAAILYSFSEQTIPFVFTISRSMAGSDGVRQARGVDRRVIFPAGGNGRFGF